jgi:hypothetical protein
MDNDYIKFYNTEDIAKMLHITLPTARAIMYRPDFPLIKVGRALKVSKPAFEEWTKRSNVNNGY